MSTQSNGNLFNVSNKPGKNGAPNDSWENVGNLYLDSDLRFGTLYLNVDAPTLKRWLAAAEASPEGKFEKKVTVARRKPKASAPAAAQPAA